MHFREAVVETELTVLEPVIGFIASLISQRPDLFRNDRIAGDNHSTFTGGDLLVGVESENSGISERQLCGPEAQLQLLRTRLQ